MLKMSIRIACLSFFFACMTAHATQLCQQEALRCYLLEPEKTTPGWTLQQKKYDAKRHVSIETYVLTSQFWPKADMSRHGVEWQHRLTLYQPEMIQTHQALLYVNGGTRVENPDSHNNPPANTLDFARLADDTHSVVVDLQDIPNQYLTFDDGKPRLEDGIVAYTWKRFMDDPIHSQYWPIHLPMAKAVIKAMDATQQIMLNHQQPVDRFVVAGASKRGLTTWLAALADTRINAIIPIVIDILNTEENIKAIYANYDNHWPPALHNYIEEGITERLDTPQFKELMMIEDPLSYLSGGQSTYYQTRLSIPKYIISASGDDFFVPDSLKLYLDKLPGETRIRVVPNQPHYINIHLVEDAILSYYQTIVNHSKRPILTWQVNKAGELQSITTNQEPAEVLLWQANNPASRDFRLAAHIAYSAEALKGKCIANHCRYTVTLNKPEKGWKAAFVEVTFKSSFETPLILSTPIYLIQSM